MITSTSLFGLDSEQQYSFLQVVEYLADNRVEGVVDFPRVPASLLSGFDIEQSRSLLKYFKQIWYGADDVASLNIKSSTLAGGFGALSRRTLQRLAVNTAEQITGGSITYPVNSWTPAALFANGEEGCWYDPADRDTVFTDLAGTALAMAENDIIARINDKSGNGYNATRVSASLRPKLAYLAGSYRRGVDYDGVDDAMATTFPALGSNCVVASARAGIGAVITSGVTINAGAMNNNTDHCGLVVLNRALTADEDAKLRVYFRQKAGVEDEYSVQYGDDSEEILDVYHSSGHVEGPIIVMVHGGAWRNGSKGSPNVTKNKLLHWLPKGYTFVSVGYRLDVGTDPIDQARSVAKALAWVQSHAEGWGCDPRNIVFMGHSAGAHLVSLVATDVNMRRQYGVKRWLLTVPLDSAAYDVVRIVGKPIHDELYDEPWGTDPNHWAKGSPTRILSAKPVPFYMVVSTDSATGESDSPNATAFADAVESFGGVATIYETPLVHSEVNSELGTPIAYTTAVDDAFAEVGLT
jgi:acetyl esterase/lipase